MKRKIIVNYDDCIKRMRRFGKYFIRLDFKDFVIVLNKLVVEGVFEFKEGRLLNCFLVMFGDFFDGFDIYFFYKWIGDYKKYIVFDKKVC